MAGFSQHFSHQSNVNVAMQQHSRFIIRTSPGILSGFQACAGPGSSQITHPDFTLMQQEFHYLALDSTGHRQEGSLRAAHIDDANRQLQALQLHIISVKAMRRSSPLVQQPAGKALKPEAIVTLVDELATLLDAGVPLAEAVATLAQSHGDEHPLSQTLRSIRSGMSFSQALEQSGL